jgi:hypothetical protein
LALRNLYDERSSWDGKINYNQLNNDRKVWRQPEKEFKNVAEMK